MIAAIVMVAGAGAELSWTDHTTETPCTTPFACSEATLTALGSIKAPGMTMYPFGVMVTASNPHAELMDMTLVVEKSDKSKDTFRREDVPMKDYKGIKHVSEIFTSLDVPVTSVLSLDTVEKTRDGRINTPHRFR